MLNAREKAGYQVNKLLLDIECDSFDKWYEHNYFYISLKNIRSASFQNQLINRLTRIHHLMALINTFEMIAIIDKRSSPDTENESENNSLYDRQ